MTESHTFDRLLDHIVTLDSKYKNSFNFLVCGDMNSRTPDNPDFVVNDNYLHRYIQEV